MVQVGTLLVLCRAQEWHWRIAEHATPEYASTACRWFWADYFQETADTGQALERVLVYPPRCKDISFSVFGREGWL